MDPKEKGNNFTKLSPTQQLDILTRYRDNNRSALKFDPESRTFIPDEVRRNMADDFFIESLDEFELGQTWIDGMVLTGRV